MSKYCVFSLYFIYIVFGNLFSEESLKRNGLESELEINILDQGLIEAMEMAIANDGRVFIAERFGKVKVWSRENENKCIEVLDLKSDYRGESVLMGIALDPNFDENQWIYLYHSVKIKDDKKYHYHYLSRSYIKIAEKYKKTLELDMTLVSKVKLGSVGAYFYVSSPSAYSSGN